MSTPAETTSTTGAPLPRPGTASPGAASPDATGPAPGRPDATLPDAVDLAVRVRGLSKTYAVGGGVHRTAVADLDLDVAHGEVFALLGPNGAGKSTTTEILEGYRHRDTGEVAVLGTDPWRAPLSWRARVGIVLQDTSEPLDLTVAELLRHWATLYPDPRPVAEVAALVGLGERLRTRVAALSGGQRRRLDVALAVIGRPELLFLDEPTTGFDPEARRQFWAVLEDLRDAGTTILLTTHYLDEAARLADRVAVVADGRLVACGPPDELGGPLRDVAVVRWRDPDGRPREERTTTPSAVVRRLLAEHAGPDARGEVPGLTVGRSSLEDVYLTLVGHEAGAGADPAQEQVTA
ncbi:ABC transporter ATP-binding protein [Aquipuribacter sp. MA13-6]|uniref:ABC transporter ATP-binding protein n=1 Tax=unclassified Aquipuribacter TaxID=2635084 RepID=UPI003EEE9FC1